MNTAKKGTGDSTTKSGNYRLKTKTSHYDVKGGSSRMVVGRNSETGRFILAPASFKSSKSLSSEKTKATTRKETRDRKPK